MDRPRLRLGLVAAGGLFGYVAMWLAGQDEPLRRTVSIEVGMQNSGLGSALATKHFAEFAMAPVPAAISAVSNRSQSRSQCLASPFDPATFVP